MNISKTSLNFRSDYYSKNVIAYDDDVSKERRNFLRDHYHSWSMPYQSLYESQPRLGEYQLQALIRDLKNRPEIELIPGTTIYRGKTLCEHPIEAFYHLKEKGVKNIVDLVGYGKTYEEKAHKAGLNYSVFSIFDNWWNITDFDSRRFVDDFVQFIKKMQEGHTFIGCQYGSNDTDIAMIFNDFFNPVLEDKAKTTIPPTDADFPMRLNMIYEALTKADKKAMGWTKEFEQRLLRKLTCI